MNHERFNSTQYLELRKMIEVEFANAYAKHPKLADQFTNPQTDWARLERMMKRENDDNTPPYYAENILLEELAEAMNAYQQGRLDDCLTELAQVGAVVMRCMVYVQNEIIYK